MKYLFALLLFFSSLTASAGDGFFKYGIGFVENQDSPVEVKIFSLGYQDHLSKLFIYQLETGLWADSKTNGTTRKSAGWGSGSVGIEVTPGPLYLQSLWGAGLITATDGLLSSTFEFTHDLSIGFRDELGRSINFGYKHFSNAGLSLPNKGRDFILIRLQVPFN